MAMVCQGFFQRGCAAGRPWRRLLGDQNGRQVVVFPSASHWLAHTVE